MIEKSFPVPASSRYTLRFPLSSLKKGGKINGVHLAHMKEEDGAFVCAEGTTLRYSSIARFENLFVTEHRVFAGITRVLYVFEGSKRFNGPQDLVSAVDYYNKDGTWDTYVVGKNMSYRLTENMVKAGRNMGGTCLARHFERLYFGKENTLYYSEPMYYDAWDYATYKSGEIALPYEYGNIIGLVSFQGKLYLFFERGISVLTAYADPLDFKLQALPFVFGTNKERTFANCGDAVYFFTERGLCKLTAAGVTLVEDADIGDIDFQQPVSAATHHGKYYASVCNQKGERIAYCYDGVTGRGSYIGHVCEKIGANDTLYISSSIYVYELSGKSFPTVGECALSVDFALEGAAGKRELLESVGVDGTGDITAILTNARGECVMVKGECGKKLRLPRAFGGEKLRLKILPADEEFAIRGLSFEVRRDEA